MLQDPPKPTTAEELNSRPLPTVEFLNLRVPVAATWVMIAGRGLFTSTVRVDLLRPGGREWRGEAGKFYKLQWEVWKVRVEKLVGLEGVDEKMRCLAKKAAEKMVKVRNKVEEKERKKQEAEREYEDEMWRRSIPYSYMFD
jgi:hypothetical protein